MNGTLKDGLLSAPGNSTLSTLAPTVVRNSSQPYDMSSPAEGTSHSDGMYSVLVPMLNTAHASEILQLATMLAGTATGPGSGPAAANPEAARASPASRTPTRIVVLSVVEVPPDEPLTMGLDMARSYRALLEFLPSEVEAGGLQARVDRVVKVARDVAGAIHQAARDERASMMLLYWKGYAREPRRHLYGRITDAALISPPCNVVLARMEGWEKSKRIFLPVRGGPSAEQALNIGMSLAERMALPVAVMHNVPAPDDRVLKAPAENASESDFGIPQSTSQVEALGEEPYIVLNEQLRRVQEGVSVPVESILTRRPDPVEALLEEARTDDLLIMGLPARATGTDLKPPAGNDPDDAGDSARSSVALRVSQAKGPPVLLVSTPASIDLAGYARKVRSRRSRKRWVDMPFEHWFVEHTYHGDEFKDPDEFVKAKQASGLTISVAVLTSNDSKHIHSVLTGLKRVLVEMHHIADQIVVVDAGSTDDTLDIARGLGVEVYQASDILPEQGDLHGRGECWWKSLAVLRGDILVWLDPRARRFHPSTALSLAGPLLRNSTLQLVKAFGQSETSDGSHKAPQNRGDDFSPVDMSWGGFVVPHRDSDTVTEKVRVQALKPSDLASFSPGQIAMLPARTLLQVLSPSLAAVIAPFSRDMAARRPAMMGTPVFAGESLELGLLLSVAAEYGTDAVAQVELRHHQPSLPPSPSVRSAIDVLQVMARRLQDPAMRDFADSVAERLQKEIEGRRSPLRPDVTSGGFEVRALGPVERPPMSMVMGDG
jgi:glucosyl-3-phosphoglycerate synthase